MEHRSGGRHPRQDPVKRPAMSAVVEEPSVKALSSLSRPFFSASVCLEIEVNHVNHSCSLLSS